MGNSPLFSPQEVQGTAQPQASAPPSGQLFSADEIANAGHEGAAPGGPGPAIPPVTTSTNPKLNIAASGENMPEYVGATGAAGAGLMGVAETGGALAVGAKALAPALTRGVVGIGQWAAEHPMTAKLIYESLKAIVYGVGAGAGAKLAGKVVNAAPDR